MSVDVKISKSLDVGETNQMWASSTCLWPLAARVGFRGVLLGMAGGAVGGVASTLVGLPSAWAGAISTSPGTTLLGHPLQDFADAENRQSEENFKNPIFRQRIDDLLYVIENNPFGKGRNTAAMLIDTLPGFLDHSIGNSHATPMGVRSVAADATITYGSIPPLGTNPNNPDAIFGVALGPSPTAVGWSGRDNNTPPHAFIWTLAGGTVDLGSLGTGDFDYSNGYAISEYADVVVGTSGSPNTTFQAPLTAFRYTVADNTMRDLGSLTPGNPVSAAYDVNFDGSVVVGSSNLGSTTFPYSHAFRWVQNPGTQSGTMTDIDGRAAGSGGSEAYAVNDNGSVAVGGIINTAGSLASAFVWTQPTGMVNIGALPGNNAAEATGVSRDGTMVVGTSDPTNVYHPYTSSGIANSTNRPFLWTAASGMQELNALASAIGTNTSGFVMLTATGISRDGRLIYGNGMDAQGNMGSYVFAYCGGGSCASPLVSAILPASRSVEVGGASATAFATIINTGATTLNGCSVQSPEGVTANFNYQTTSAATNGLIGTANTPVSLAPNAAQSFVFAFAPTAAFAPIDLPLVFNCTGQFPVAPQSGLNTLLISASTTPVPDIVALGATVSNDGVLHITGTSGSAAFAVATVDVGAGDTITATANTGSATLPLALALCQTNPSTGACMASPSASVTATIAANATPTFGIFGTASGAIAFDPANSRIFVQFTDSSGTVRGETSVAVETQ